jgi:hypothetical protein
LQFAYGLRKQGTGNKGGTYLVCDAAQRGRGCTGIRWRYRDFEASFLTFVEELDIESIVHEGADTEKRRALEGELAALRGELTSVDDLMEKTFAVLAAGGPVEFVTSKLNEMKLRQNDLTERLHAKDAENREFLSRESRFQSSKEEIRQLVLRLQGPADEELFKLRAQIASQLKVLVLTLSVASLGSKPRLQASIERLRGIAGKEDAVAHMSRAAVHPDHSRRYFAVGFRGSNVRVVYPNDDDPLQFKQQVVASEASGFEVLRPETAPL